MAIDTCSLEKTTDFMLHLQSNRPPYLNTYLPGWTNGPTWLDEWAPQVGRMGLPGWTNGPTWLDQWAPQVGRMGKMR